MKIAFKSFIINPQFMVNRMLSKQQHQKCADDFHCRILMLEKDGKPLYHVSIDTVEIYLSYRDHIKEVIENKLGYPIDLITSATHSHYCPCLTTDTNYQEILLDRIAKEITDIKIIEINDLSYSYQYEFFDKTGK